MDILEFFKIMKLEFNFCINFKINFGEEAVKYFHKFADLNTA